MFIFSTFTTHAQKKDIELHFVQTSTNTGTADLEIINHSDADIFLLDVFTESKLRDINFFLPMEQRLINENVIQNSKGLHLRDDSITFVDDWEIKYDSSSEIFQKVLNNWKLAKFGFQYLIHLRPNQKKTFTYCFDEVKVYNNAFKTFPTLKKAPYYLSITYQGNKDSVINKLDFNSKIYSTKAFKKSRIFEGVVTSNTIEITSNNFRSSNDVYRKKRYWYNCGF